MIFKPVSLYDEMGKTRGNKNNQDCSDSFPWSYSYTHEKSRQRVHILKSSFSKFKSFFLRKIMQKAKQVNENCIRKLMKLFEFYRLEFTVSFLQDHKIGKLHWRGGASTCGFVCMCGMFDGMLSVRFPLFKKEQKGYEGFRFFSMTKQTYYYSFVNSITIIYNSTEIVHPCRLKHKVLFG